VMPSYTYIDLDDISNTCDACVPVPGKIEKDSNGDPLPPGRIKTYEYSAVMAPGTVYVIYCDDPTDQLILPSPDLQETLKNVAIISECRIKGQSNMRLEGVTLVSSAVGDGNKPYDMTTIHFPAGTYLGKQDGCAPGGGVRIYTAASVRITAGAAIMGVQIVARGDVEFSASQNIDGLSIQAGEDIRMTANTNIGTGCLGGIDGVFAYHYRLVR